MPEVALVAILDADKEGFLRSERSLIQTIGRAARNVNGRAILYGDKVTGSMQRAIDETKRRRKKQQDFNEANGITPQALNKKITDIMEGASVVPGRKIGKKDRVADSQGDYEVELSSRTPEELRARLKEMENEMYKAAKDLEFEKAAALRDQITEINERLLM